MPYCTETFISFQSVLAETVHSAGLFMLVFIVLPNFDPLTGVLITLNVAALPGVLKIVFPQRTVRDDLMPHTSMAVIRGMNFLGVLLHLAGLGFMAYYCYRLEPENEALIAIIVLAGIFTSVNWWENFIPKGEKESSGLRQLKRKFSRGKTKIMCISVSWKIVLTLCIMPVVLVEPSCGRSCINFLFIRTTSKDGPEIHNDILNTKLTDFRDFCTDLDWLPFLIAIVHVFMNGICYKFCKAACKVIGQRLAFGLPLLLVTPITLSLVLAFLSTTSITINSCKLSFPMWKGDVTIIQEHIDDYWLMIVGGLLSYVSFLLITNHIWTPRKERLQPTDK